MPRPRVVLPLLLVLLVTAVGVRPAILHLGSAHRAAQASTTPTPNWLPADKQGFGTSHTLASKVWFTLAWSIHAGRPVEQPSVVACRYVRRCPTP